jgi:hypothetical protein
MDQDFRYFPLDVDTGDVAKDVCEGYQTAQMGFDAHSKPGLFYVEGAYTDPDEVVKKFPKKIKEAEEMQRTWFKTLVKIADDDWARSPQHKHIGDLQRAAARYLNLERAWLDIDINSTVKCPACMSIVSTEAAVCFACKAVLDPAKFAKMKFATA